VKISYEAITDPAMVQKGWKGYLKTSVIDNGRGIAKKKLKTLFYCFKSSLANEEHGVGIGLSTARTITKALGGTINIESNMNQGTTVIFTTLVHSQNFKISVEELNKSISP